MDRNTLLEQLAACITGLNASHPLRVGIDGPDASGKTTLAAELAETIQASGRPVVRASIDRFHYPRAYRYRRGPDSPEGYYEDSFDLPALHRLLLDPLAPNGSRIIQTELFDFRSDTSLNSETASQVAANAILIFDGVFLLRPELKDAWDFTIFLQVDFRTILARAMQRDVNLMGSPETVRLRYLNRYLPAQQMYLSRYRPDLNANALIVNDDPLQPALQRLILPSQKRDTDEHTQ